MGRHRQAEPVTRTLGLWSSEGHPLSGRADFGIDALRVDGVTQRVAQTDVMVLPFGALRGFCHPAVGRGITLVVAPLAGAFPVLLRDLVIGLLKYRQVAVTDWRNSREVPEKEGSFGLAENVNFVANAMRQLGPDLHVVGVCQGSITALAATALISEEQSGAAPRSLTLIGGPIDPLATRTRVADLLGERPLSWFEANALETVPPAFRGAGRRVYPARRQLAVLLGYLSRHMRYDDDLFWKIMCDDGEDPLRFPFLKLCTRLMDLPAELLLDMVRHVYQNRDLCRGCLRIGGRTIDLAAISRTALLTVEGERDDIAGPGQTKAAHRLCRSVPAARRRHLSIKGVGHFALFHGRAWRQQVLPEIIRCQDSASLHR